MQRKTFENDWIEVLEIRAVQNVKNSNRKLYALAFPRGRNPLRLAIRKEN